MKNNGNINRIIRELQNDDILNVKKFIIMTILYIIKRTTITDLSRIVNLPLSTLQAHLKRLQELGYVRIRKAITTKGVRTVVEISEQGIRKYVEVYEKLKIFLKYIDNVMSK